MNFNKVPQLVYLFGTLILNAVIIAGLFFYISESYFKKLGTEIMVPLYEAHKVELKQLDDNYRKLNKDQIEVLQLKMDAIEKHKTHHLELIDELFKYNYAFFTMLPFLSAITAILAFFVLQRGWVNSHFFLKVFFIFYASVTALFGAYPEVYQQRENLQNNLGAYREYQTLQKQIVNYTVAAPLMKDSTDTLMEMKFDDFLRVVNRKEEELAGKLDITIEKRTVSEELENQFNTTGG